MSFIVGQQRPNLPHDVESAAPLQVLPTQVYPNNTLASDSQPSQALAESRRLWILENAPSHYQRIYSSDADAPVHLQLGYTPFTLGQQYLPGPPHDGESAAQLRVLPTQVHPNDNADTPVHFQFESIPFTGTWGQQYLPGPPNDGESAAQLVLPTQVHPNDDADTPVHFQFEATPFTWGQQYLPGPPHDVESAAKLQALPNQVYSNDGLAYSDANTVHSQFGSAPATLGQGRIPGPPHDGGSPAQPQFWESEVRRNDAPRLEAPGLAQSTGGAHEQSPEIPVAQLTGAQEAEPHQHSSAASGEQFTCNWANCVAVTDFKRTQDLTRHMREVHGSEPPCKCPFCPPDRRPWKRAYLMKGHLIDDHREEFGEGDFERLLILKGKGVFEFVDAIEPSQS